MWVSHDTSWRMQTTGDVSCLLLIDSFIVWLFRVNCEANGLISMHKLVTEVWCTTVHFDSWQLVTCCAAGVCIYFPEAFCKLKSTFVYEMSRTSVGLIDWTVGGSEHNCRHVREMCWNRCLMLSTETGRKVFPQMGHGTNTAGTLQLAFWLSLFLKKICNCYSVAFYISFGWQLWYSVMESVTMGLLGLDGSSVNANCSDPHSFGESPFGPCWGDGWEREQRVLGD